MVKGPAHLSRVCKVLIVRGVPNQAGPRKKKRRKYESKQGGRGAEGQGRGRSETDPTKLDNVEGKRKVARITAKLNESINTRTRRPTLTYVLKLVPCACQQPGTLTALSTSVVGHLFYILGWTGRSTPFGQFRYLVRFLRVSGYCCTSYRGPVTPQRLLGNWCCFAFFSFLYFS